MYIKTKNLPDAWFQAVYNLIDYNEQGELKNGNLYRIDQGSYEQSWRLEYPFVAIEVEYPLSQPLLPDFPPHTGLPPVADMDYVYEYFYDYIMSDRVPENTAYTYGSRIQQVLYTEMNAVTVHGKVTQLDYLIERLNAHPKSNQLVLQIARPEDIMLVDPPCLRSVALKVIDGCIDLHIYFRSNDLWGGFPVNLAALALFLNFLTLMTPYKEGKFYYFCSGLHIYHHNFEYAAQRCQKPDFTKVALKLMGMQPLQQGACLAHQDEE